MKIFSFLLFYDVDLGQSKKKNRGKKKMGGLKFKKKKKKREKERFGCSYGLGFLTSLVKLVTSFLDIFPHFLFLSGAFLPLPPSMI